MIILNTFSINWQLPKRGSEGIIMKPVLYSFIGRGKKKYFLKIKIPPLDISGKLSH